jgi:hypothetical protein
MSRMACDYLVVRGLKTLRRYKMLTLAIQSTNTSKFRQKLLFVVINFIHYTYMSKQGDQNVSVHLMIAVQKHTSFNHLPW